MICVPSIYGLHEERERCTPFNKEIVLRKSTFCFLDGVPLIRSLVKVDHFMVIMVLTTHPGVGAPNMLPLLEASLSSQAGEQAIAAEVMRLAAATTRQLWTEQCGRIPQRLQTCRIWSQQSSRGSRHLLLITLMMFCLSPAKQSFLLRQALSQHVRGSRRTYKLRFVLYGKHVAH